MQYLKTFLCTFRWEVSVIIVAVFFCLYYRPGAHIHGDIIIKDTHSLTRSLTHSFTQSLLTHSLTKEDDHNWNVLSRMSPTNEQFLQTRHIMVIMWKIINNYFKYHLLGVEFKLRTSRTTSLRTLCVVNVNHTLGCQRRTLICYTMFHWLLVDSPEGINQ